MKLFEVIFAGSPRRGDEDTIYLVRAPDFCAAIEEVRRSASPSNHNGETAPLAHVVYELGVDLSPYAESSPGILRGPYFQPAYNRGWKAWHRKIAESDYTGEWEEEIWSAEPHASPRDREA